MTNKKILDKPDKEETITPQTQSSVFDFKVTEPEKQLKTKKEKTEKNKLLAPSPPPGKIKIEDEDLEVKEDTIKYVYYLYIGDTEAEFYTFQSPEVIDGAVYIKNVIKKEVIKEQVLEHVITIPFKASIQLQNLKLPIADSEGIIIKCSTYNSSDLKWIYKSKEDAVEEMKTAKLQVYDKVLPEIYKQMQNRRQQFNDNELEEL